MGCNAITLKPTKCDRLARGDTQKGVLIPDPPCHGRAMQLAMFDTPPAEPRRQSSSRRVGGSASAKKGKGPLIRLQGRSDRPRPKSAPGLSFLKPTPDSAAVEVEVDQTRQEARGPEPVVEEAVVGFDNRVGTTSV